jgi:hypothetical protein
MNDPAPALKLAWLTAVTLALFGVEPQSIIYATMGAGVGTIFSPSVVNGSPWRGRVKAVAIFVGVAVICAGIGTLISQVYFAKNEVWRNVVAAFSAVLFLPIVSTIIAKLPELWDGAMRKFGLKA